MSERQIYSNLIKKFVEHIKSEMAFASTMAQTADNVNVKSKRKQNAKSEKQQSQEPELLYDLTLVFGVRCVQSVYIINAKLNCKFSCAPGRG